MFMAGGSGDVKEGGLRLVPWPGSDGLRLGGAAAHRGVGAGGQGLAGLASDIGNDGLVVEMLACM